MDRAMMGMSVTSCLARPRQLRRRVVHLVKAPGKKNRFQSPGVSMTLKNGLIDPFISFILGKNPFFLRVTDTPGRDEFL